MFAWTGETWDKAEKSDSSIKTSSLSIASYNVLHDIERQHITQPEIRFNHQLKIFQHENFDILGLCEVTQNYLDILLSDKWIQNNYFISHLSAKEFHEHGTILLTKFPFSSLVTTTVETLKRPITIGTLKIDEKKSLAICMAHLIAYERNYESRKFQLGKVCDILDKMGTSSIIMGDLNFHQKFEDDYIRQDYVDVWTKIHGKDSEGYTYDPSENKMIYEKLPIAFEYRKMRLDRILVISDILEPVNIRIFANIPVFPQVEKNESTDYLYYLRWPLRSISSTIIDWTFYQNIWRDPKDYLYPSDHFGLHAIFNIK